MQTPFSQSIDAFRTDAGPGLARNASFHVPLNFFINFPQIPCQVENDDCRIMNVELGYFIIFKKRKSEAIPSFDIPHSTFAIHYYPGLSPEDSEAPFSKEAANASFSPPSSRVLPRV
jgi:hypothetical protein